MKSPFQRIISVLVALVIAILLVSGISLFGSKSAGPVEDLFRKISGTVSRMEENYILNQRTQSRANKLSWFEPYKNDISLLKYPKQILLGAYDNQVIPSFQPIIDLEDSLGITFPIIHIYTAWGSKREQRFPEDQVRAISTLGSLPLITWEPWLNDFTEDDIPNLKKIDNRDKNGLADIASGIYDSYLIRWANDAKASGTNILLRFGHEMNDPYRYPWGPQNNKAEEYKAAWRHVVKVFQKQGADNVLWVWAPHLAYGFFEDYYPGEEYVDWIGTGTLNYGTVAPWSQWWSFDEIFARYYEELASYKKPILIAEFGSLTVGGNREEWYSKALKEFPSHFPQVKSLVFFHNNNDATTTYQTLNWYIINDKSVLDEVKKQLETW